MPAAPNVTLVTTDFDADAVLETLTSKCVPSSLLLAFVQTGHD